MHRMASRRAIADQLETRIGNQRRSGIRYQRNALAAFKIAQHPCPLTIFIVIMQWTRRGMNGKVLQQLGGVPRIFAIDDVCAQQNTQCPQRDVAKIADWRCNKVQPRRKWFASQSRDIARDR